MVSQFPKCLISLLILTTAWGHPSKYNLQGYQVPVTNSPVSVQRTVDCPDGLELVGKSCVSVQTFTPNLVCPPPSTLVNGNCVSFARALRVCPLNFSQSADRCIRTEFIPASLVCDKGALTGNRCNVEIETPSTCPLGFRLQEGQCLRFTPQIKRCPTGYHPLVDQCVKRTVLPSNPLCPSDYSLAEDGSCRKSIPIPPSCDLGFTLTSTYCHREVPKVPSPCSDGFRTFAQSCQREQQSAPQPECPAGFILDVQNQCVKEVPIPASCPYKATRSSTGQCERSVAMKPVCGNGEELLQTGRCRQTLVLQSKQQCPTDYILVNGQCKRVRDEKPRYRCAKVSLLEDDKCVVRTSSPTRIQCPVGYQVDKTFRCVKDVTYDCPKETKEAVSESECEQQDVKAGEKTSLVMAEKGMLVPVTIKIPKAGCNKECIRTDVSPGQFVCPKGSFQEGKACISVSTYPPDVYCTVGNLDKETGKCIIIDIKQPASVCSTGQLQPDGTCQEIKERVPTFVCRDGSPVANDRCVVSVPQVIHPNEVVRQEPQGVCYEGVKRGAVCIQTYDVPRAQMCPFGSEESESGRCVVKRPVINSAPMVVSREPDYVCPQGSSEMGKLCSLTDRVPPEHLCPDNGVMKDSRCLYSAELVDRPPRVEVLEARLSCPSGYEQQGNQCGLTTIEQPVLECPLGYNRLKDGDHECARSRDQIPVCPIGTDKIAGSCVKKTYVPPRVTEIKVCTKGQPGC